MASIVPGGSQLLALYLMLNPFCYQQSFSDAQYKQLEETRDWVVKARHLRDDLYELVLIVKPDTLWDIQQALKRKGVDRAETVTYLIETKRVDFDSKRTQLLELRWYDAAGNELHKDSVDDPPWELEERRVQLLRKAFGT